LFNLGREAALAGKAMDALEYWKRAFHLDASYRNAVIQALAPRLPAIAFVQHFQPSPEETEALFHFYRVRNADAEAKVVAPILGSYLTELGQTQEGAAAMETWMKCVDIYRCVGDGAGAVKAARLAVAANPNDFQARVALANQLTKEQQFDEAEEHWFWCARRHPHDKSLVRQLERVQSLRVASGRAELTDAAAVQ
jgi:thioredoxin-like negative regulator of GroEL